MGGKGRRYGRPGWLWTPRVGQNIKFIRRGGIYPARGRLRRRRVRRDEGIPPYGRPDGHSRSGLAGHFGRFVGEGHGPPGDLAAARFPGWPRRLPLAVGADSISARGCLRRRKPGRYLRPKSRTCGPVGLRNAPAGAVESAPTGGCHTVKTVVSRLAAHPPPRTNLIFQATHPYCLPQKTRKIPHSSFLISHFLPPLFFPNPAKKRCLCGPGCGIL